MPLFPFLYPRTWCDSLRAAGRQPWQLELRDTTKSQQATELVWEVYWGTRRGWPLRGEQEEWGSGRACLLLLRESALLGNCGSDSYSVFAAAADLSC